MKGVRKDMFSYDSPDFLDDDVDDLLADGVVPPGVIVGRIFLPVDQLVGVEETAVLANANFV